MTSRSCRRPSTTTGSFVSGVTMSESATSKITHGPEVAIGVRFVCWRASFDRRGREGDVVLHAEQLHVLRALLDVAAGRTGGGAPDVTARPRAPSWRGSGTASCRTTRRTGPPSSRCSRWSRTAAASSPSACRTGSAALLYLPQGPAAAACPRRCCFIVLHDAAVLAVGGLALVARVVPLGPVVDERGVRARQPEPADCGQRTPARASASGRCAPTGQDAQAAGRGSRCRSPTPMTGVSAVTNRLARRAVRRSRRWQARPEPDLGERRSRRAGSGRCNRRAVSRAFQNRLCGHTIDPDAVDERHEPEQHAGAAPLHDRRDQAEQRRARTAWRPTST